MEKINKTQIIGIAIVTIGIASYFLVENNITQTTSGILCAIGLGLILKWIPFKKKNLTD